MQYSLRCPPWHSWVADVKASEDKACGWKPGQQLESPVYLIQSRTQQKTKQHLAQPVVCDKLRLCNRKS